MSSILQYLQAAYYGSKEERTAATAALNAALKADPAQGLFELLSHGTNPDAPNDMSLLAVLQVKNFLQHDLVSDQLRDTVALDRLETALFQALPVARTKTHRRAVLEAMDILISEYNWNFFAALLTELQQFPASPQCVDEAAREVLLHKAHTGLEAMYLITRRFRGPGPWTFASKIEMCQSLLPELPKYLSVNDMHTYHITFKIFQCVLEIFMEAGEKATTLINEAVLHAWLTHLGSFATTHYSTCVGTTVYEEYVKCVKRIGAICFSVLQEATKRRGALPLQRFFMQNYSVSFFNQWVAWLRFIHKNSPSCDRNTIHRKSEVFAIRYIKMSTLDPSLGKSCVEPVALELISELLFPYLCLSEEDEEFYADESNLQEYVQYIQDDEMIGGEFSQRTAATNCILAIVGSKKGSIDSSGILMSLLGALSTNLGTTDPKQAFGFLHLLGIVRKLLKERKEIWSTQVEPVLIQFVVPRLSAPEPYLRVKAAWVCNRYCRIPIPSEDNFRAFVAVITQLIMDTDAKVRLAAVNASISYLGMKRARPYLISVLVPLVNECLSLLERVQCPVVPITLNYLAENFAPELTDVLDRLAASLVQQFLAATFEMTAREGDEGMLGNEAHMKAYDMLGMSAVTCLEAIDSLVLSTEHNPAVLERMRPDLMRLITQSLQPAATSALDCIEKVIDILMHVTFFTRPLTPDVWAIFPSIYGLVMDGGGVDFFSKLEGIFDNFVSNGTVEFLSSAEVMGMSHRMCEKMLLGGVVVSDDDILAVPQFIEAIVHSAGKPEVPHELLANQLHPFIVLLLQGLANDDIKNTRVRIWLISALMDCFFFDPSLTMRVLVQSNAFPYFFNAYFSFFAAAVGGSFSSSFGNSAKKKTGKKNAKKDASEEAAQEVVSSLSILNRKVNILGLVGFLRVATDPPGEILAEPVDPTILRAALQMIVYCIGENCNLYVKRLKRMKMMLDKLRSGEESDDAESYDEEDLDLQEEEEDDGHDIAHTTDGTEADNDEDSAPEVDADEEMESDETDEYFSPIDSICEVTMFAEWCARPESAPLLSACQDVMAQRDLLGCQKLSREYVAVYHQLHTAEEDLHKRRAAAAAAAVAAAIAK
jgi:hypothetical protein